LEGISKVVLGAGDPVEISNNYSNLQYEICLLIHEVMLCWIDFRQFPGGFTMIPDGLISAKTEVGQYCSFLVAIPAIPIHVIMENHYFIAG